MDYGLSVSETERKSRCSRYIITACKENLVVENETAHDFDRYMNKAFSHWTLKMPSRQDWLCNAVCNCPAFYKNFICKHIVGMAIRLQYEKARLEAKNIPIGQKRKRGRPTKAKKALILNDLS